MISFMCGRYRLSRRKQLVEEYFDAHGDDDWTPRYNIAPTQPVFFFQAEDGIRGHCVTGVQTCALPICCELGKETDGGVFADGEARPEFAGEAERSFRVRAAIEGVPGQRLQGPREFAADELLVSPRERRGAQRAAEPDAGVGAGRRSRNRSVSQPCRHYRSRSRRP